MEFIALTKELKEYPKIRRLYKTAFPASERAPFWMLIRRAQPGKADFWAIYDQGRWVGMSYVLCHEDLAYVFYLAINDELRGMGYGQQTVAALKEHYKGRRLFLAIERLDPEAENYDQRLSRHRFYIKCGLEDLPYYIKEASEVYQIMGMGGVVQPKEYKALIDGFMGPVMGRLVDMRILEDLPEKA